MKCIKIKDLNKETVQIKPTADSTEERIKAAARVVFQQKGYAAARTRDIAEEAGINLALLNYYFRSKDKLFEAIMSETLEVFVKGLLDVVNDESTSFEEKINLVIDRYNAVFSAEPNIPIFVLSELRNRPLDFVQKMPIKKIIDHSVFARQFKEKVATNEIVNPDPSYLVVNLIGLIVMPYIAHPILTSVLEMDEEHFQAMMERRRTLIPFWLHTMLQIK